jgi:DNA anti-recombination protein RmuC
MSTNILNQAVPFSKAALYDKIGELNIKIVALEEEIPALESQLTRVVNNCYEGEEQLSAELHEKRHDLHLFKTSLTQVRMRLRSTLELELERTDRGLREAYSSAANLEDMTSHRAQLALEIEKLTKILDNNGEN